MAIVARKGILKLIVAIFCCAAITLMIYRLGKRVFGVRECQFTISPILSSNLIQSIQNTLIQAHAFTVCTAHECVASLYPDISSIEITKFGNNVADVTVVVPEPVVQINDNMILTSSGSLVKKELCNPLFVKSLSVVTVAGFDVLTTAAKSWIIRWVPHLSQQYSIIFVHENEIHLRDKNNQLDLICTINTKFDAAIQKQIARMQDIVLEKVSQRSRVQGWTADLRFEKQIILSGTQGGRKYG